MSSQLLKGLTLSDNSLYKCKNNKERQMHLENLDELIRIGMDENELKERESIFNAIKYG